MLNDYFLSDFTWENLATVPEVVQVFEGDDNDKLRDVVITTQVVQEEITMLKKNKSPGPDKIFPRVLKEGQEVLSGPLTDFFKMSVNSGYVPNQWKVANVTPIFEKGDKSATSNYRLISLTSVVGKMLESIIARGIRDHLEKQNLIHDSQHGFMKGKSCLTYMLSFYARVIKTADRDENYDVLYLYFSKAFDIVPHYRLLLKLQVHGVDGIVLGWINALLSGI